MNITKEELKSVQVGDVIEFAEIDWRVLAKTADTVLIISEKVLAGKPYNEKMTAITWEQCTLRKWLNEDFYSIFTDEEKAMIAETNVVNSDNAARYGTKGGNNTVDRIFLLSLDEAEKYFVDDKSRAVGSWWWLRSPGNSQYFAAHVYDDGSLFDYGYVVYGGHGVRPALNLKF